MSHVLITSIPTLLSRFGPIFQSFAWLIEREYENPQLRGIHSATKYPKILSINTGKLMNGFSAAENLCGLQGRAILGSLGSRVHHIFFFFQIFFLLIFNVYMQLYGHERPTTPFTIQSSKPPSQLTLSQSAIFAFSRRPRCFIGIGLWATCPPSSVHYFRVTCSDFIPHPFRSPFSNRHLCNH